MPCSSSNTTADLVQILSSPFNQSSSFYSIIPDWLLYTYSSIDLSFDLSKLNLIRSCLDSSYIIGMYQLVLPDIPTMINLFLGMSLSVLIGLAFTTTLFYLVCREQNLQYINYQWELCFWWHPVFFLIYCLIHFMSKIPPFDSLYVCHLFFTGSRYCKQCLVSYLLVPTVRYGCIVSITRHRLNWSLRMASPLPLRRLTTSMPFRSWYCQFFKWAHWSFHHITTTNQWYGSRGVLWWSRFGAF